MILGLILAVASAAATNLAFLFKHRGAVAAPPIRVRHPLASAAGLFRSKWFAVGLAVAVVAWLLHVGALALAPLSIAQAVLSSPAGSSSSRCSRSDSSAFSSDDDNGSE